MLLDIRQEGVAAKLMAIAAMLALSLGIIFIGTGQAYATHEDPKIYKMEATVVAPVVGEAPSEECTIKFYREDGTQLSENEYGKELSWHEAESTTTGKPTKFESGKTYQVFCRASYYNWNDQSSECPGVAEKAEGYVNGNPSTQSPSVNHNYQSMLHFISVSYTWTLHEVTFNPNGGSGEMADQTIYKEEEAELNDNTFTREGYEFTGWNTETDGSGTPYGDKEAVKSEEDITLYAQWAPVVYKVTVTADPAEGGTASADKQEAAMGDTVNLSATPNDGYEFLEWVTVTEGVTIEDGKFTMPASDVEVQATFKEKPKPVTVTHTVAFDANGGTGSMDAIEGEEGTEATLTANKFTRDGYTFEGWNTKADGSGTAYEDSAKIKLDADITLYAQWEVIPAPIVTHSVTFDANGGTGSMDTLTGEEGSEVALTANKFTRDGYTFKGWNTAKDGTGTAYADKANVKLDADITLYAQWEKNASSPSSTKATSSSNSRTLANTGDSLPVALIALPACTALAAIAVLALARRRIR